MKRRKENCHNLYIMYQKFYENSVNIFKVKSILWNCIINKNKQNPIFII